MPSRRAEVIVYLDALDLGPRRAVGVLHATSGSRPVISFIYARSWLDRREAFAIDPDLPLVEQEQYVRDGGLPGIFADTAPDRWGRQLMQRRESQVARRAGRRPRALDDWDYLMGVSDVDRMGALRLARQAGDTTFLDDRERAVPPLTSLRELEHGAHELERTGDLSDEDEATWLALLLAPGSSLGGVRPKASFVADDGLWIAKFPSRADTRDVGAWEFLLADLATPAGIDVAGHRLLKLGSDHHTFAGRRFDRVAGDRRLFASAMTLARKRDGEEASYLDIAIAIADHGTPESIPADLAQLFRRVVFNVLVGDRDDQMRNHGFLREPSGWRLAPAFDVNPTPEKVEHSLAIDGDDPRPDIERVRETADWYRVRRSDAERIIREVSEVVGQWRQRARVLGVSRDEIDLIAPAFAVG